jgi:hypothetical protein
MSGWHELKTERNRQSLARLNKALPTIFPSGVLSRPLSRPFVPPTPRLAIESYWGAHPFRADRLARALAARSGAPSGWTWRLGDRGRGLPGSFRTPPAPYREREYAQGPVLVAGWSAGGNIAAVTCQLARDRGGPQISGQLLVCPVTDCTFDRPSYNENATGYFLTRSLMYWFWDIYCSPADRTDPRASPLRGKLEGLPPAFVVTCEFDPLRDEGIAYAEALVAAGVPIEQLEARGHFHASFAMVDVVITGVSGRARMAEALRRFAKPPKAAGQFEQGMRPDRTVSPPAHATAG